MGQEQSIDEARITTTDVNVDENDTHSAMNAINDQINRLQQEMDIKQLQIDELQLNAIKLNKAGKRKQALNELSKKKQRVKAVEMLNAQMLNLEREKINLEQHYTAVKTFEAMKQASRALNALQNQISREDIENDMDELSMQKDASDSLIEAVSTSTNIHEDTISLEDELEELMTLETTDNTHNTHNNQVNVNIPEYDDEWDIDNVTFPEVPNHETELQASTNTNNNNNDNNNDNNTGLILTNPI